MYLSKQQKFWGGILVIIILLIDLIYLNVEVTTTRRQLFKIADQLAREPSVSKSVASATPSFANCLTLKEASQHVGEEACVEGKLDHIFTSQKGTIFLNFCPDYQYQTCPFQGVIFKSEAGKFSQLNDYQGKIIQISGLIKTYRGKAEIIINDPVQIKLK